MHIQVDPAILYFGTPVVLVSSLNEDGSPNLAPMRIHPSRLAEIPESMDRPQPRQVIPQPAFSLAATGSVS